MNPDTWQQVLYIVVPPLVGLAFYGVFRITHDVSKAASEAWTNRRRRDV